MEEVAGVLQFIDVETLEWHDLQQKMRWTTVHLWGCEQVKSNPTKTPKTPEGWRFALNRLQWLLGSAAAVLDPSEEVSPGPSSWRCLT